MIIIVKKLSLLFFLVLQCLYFDLCFASAPQTLGFIDVHYRESINDNNFQDKLEIVRAATESVLLNTADQQKISLVDISDYVATLKRREGSISLEEADMPKLLKELKSTNTDYYIVAYVNSISVNNESSFGGLPISSNIVMANSNNSIVHANLSLVIYSAKTQKAIFRATGFGESTKSDVNVISKYVNVNTVVKNAFDQQVINALEKATRNAVEKVVKVI